VLSFPIIHSTPDANINATTKRWWTLTMTRLCGPQETMPRPSIRRTHHSRTLPREGHLLPIGGRLRRFSSRFSGEAAHHSSNSPTQWEPWQELCPDITPASPQFQSPTLNAVSLHARSDAPLLDDGALGLFSFIRSTLIASYPVLYSDLHNMRTFEIAMFARFCFKILYFI
jgi:hypothetical protein